MQETVQPGEYFIGELHRATWITDSIKFGAMKPLNEYYISRLTDEKRHKQYSLQQKTSYTITEALKIYEHYNEKNTSAGYWKKKQEEGIVPSRTCDSMREFVKKQIRYGIKDYLAFHIEKIKYSHF